MMYQQLCCTSNYSVLYPKHSNNTLWHHHTLPIHFTSIQHYAVHISIVEVSWNTHVPVPAVHCTYQLLCTSTLYTLLTMPVHCTSTLNLYTVPIHCASGPVHVYCASTMYAVPIPVEPLYSQLATSRPAWFQMSGGASHNLQSKRNC